MFPNRHLLMCLGYLGTLKAIVLNHEETNLILKFTDDPVPALFTIDDCRRSVSAIVSHVNCVVEAQLLCTFVEQVDAEAVPMARIFGPFRRVGFIPFVHDERFILK